MKYYICESRGIPSFRSRNKCKYLLNIVGGKRTTRVKEKAAKVWKLRKKFVSLQRQNNILAIR